MGETRPVSCDITKPMDNSPKGGGGRMRRRREPWLLCLLFVFALSPGWTLAQAQTVKITPLGQRTGEFCARDVALLFEDPTGVRILYDPGVAVGGTDRRLGDVHVILVSHHHFDHIGSSKMNQDPDDPKAVCTY